MGTKLRGSPNINTGSTAARTVVHLVGDDDEKLRYIISTIIILINLISEKRTLIQCHKIRLAGLKKCSVQRAERVRALRPWPSRLRGRSQLLVCKQITLAGQTQLEFGGKRGRRTRIRTLTPQNCQTHATAWWLGGNWVVAGRWLGGGWAVFGLWLVGGWAVPRRWLGDGRPISFANLPTHPRTPIGHGPALRS